MIRDTFFQKKDHGIVKKKGKILIPKKLFWFLRVVQEDIEAKKEITRIPSIDLMKADYIFGGLVEEDGDIYKFTYLPCPKEKVCKWVLFLNKKEIKDIASGKTKAITLYSCEYPECECKYSKEGVYDIDEIDNG